MKIIFQLPDESTIESDMPNFPCRKDIIVLNGAIYHVDWLVHEFGHQYEYIQTRVRLK